MSLARRLEKKIAREAARFGLIGGPAELVTGDVGRLQSFTSESGQQQSPNRPPSIYFGLTDEFLFAYGSGGSFTARGRFALLTHATKSFGSLNLQWVTPRETAACLDVTLTRVDEVFNEMKLRRDALWMQYSRATQLELLWLSGSRPGVRWKNGTDRSGFDQSAEAFLKGGGVGSSDSVCGLVASQVKR